MNYLLSFITAVVISMAIIPLMARLAPRVGMIDRPDPRKVHANPIPRAGGVGIVVGSLVPVAMWLVLDDITAAYLFGALVLLIFGVWDDISELGHYVKFIGQLIAVVPVVYVGDLYVTHLPFLDMQAIPESVGKPFTVFALMGMINAINHSDGLDGLAGGMSLLSLACLGYLAFLSGGEGATGGEVVLVALATIGGVFGFLRYNTHPAKVFMGDGGSQFLGFTLGFLTVYLVENVNPALSPALPALILGLPIVDILAVFVQRIYHGMNWFRASKNHIHHRLLQLGFDHYEAVIIIYSVQILLVVSAIFLAYESDLLVLSLYIGVCAGLFAFLITAERRGWQAHSTAQVSFLTKTIQAIKGHKLFFSVPLTVVAIVIPLMFVTVSVFAIKVPRDLGILAAMLAIFLLMLMMFRHREDSIVTQAISYITAAFIVYLESRYHENWSAALDTLEILFFALLATAIGLSIRYGNKTEFSTTPMDYLVVFIVIFSGYLLLNVPGNTDLGSMAIKLIILFYGCELIFSRMRTRWHALNFSALTALSVIAVRGLI